MPISFDPSDRSARAQAHFHAMAATHMRPIARKYDDHEHDLPTEWVDWYWSTGRFTAAGGEGPGDGFVQVCIQAEELCWGDAGLYLRTPFAGLGGSAVGATGTPEQKRRFLAVFGGHGYIREYLPELHLRNARGLAAFECIALV